MKSNEQSAAGPEPAPVMHKVLYILCLIGTLALLAGGVFFAAYYFQNQDKLFIADIDYSYAPGRGPERPLFHVSYEQTMLMQQHFQWGGCSAQKHDKLGNTFRLHCWGLAKDMDALKKDIESKENAPPALTTPAQRKAARSAAPAVYVTDMKQEKLSTQKKIIALLGAFAYHKLHLNIVAPQQGEKPPAQQ